MVAGCWFPSIFSSSVSREGIVILEGQLTNLNATSGTAPVSMTQLVEPVHLTLLLPAPNSGPRPHEDRAPCVQASPPALLWL